MRRAAAAAGRGVHGIRRCDGALARVPIPRLVGKSAAPMQSLFEEISGDVTDNCWCSEMPAPNAALRCECRGRPRYYHHLLIVVGDAQGDGFGIGQRRAAVLPINCLLTRISGCAEPHQHLWKFKKP
jgi:hypothetical protein